MGMMLNTNAFYYLDSTKELRSGSVWWQHLNFVDSDYYYYEFKHMSVFQMFPIEDLIPARDIQRIRNREIKLVVNNSHESFHNVVQGVYEGLIVTAKLPPSQIILMSESADILFEIRKFSKLYNVEEMKCVWTRIMEFDIKSNKQLIMSVDGYTELNTLEDKVYNKKFINFNRRWRLHRPVLVSLLYANDLLDKGYVSMASSDDNRSWQTVWSSMLSCHANTPEIVNLLKNNEQHILNMPNLYIDTNDLVTNRAILDSSTDYLYENTYFSVVSETNYYTSNMFEDGSPSVSYHGFGRHLTEKIFKTIANKHPALLVSPPHSLIKLRELGYKTFSPWIDESYDLELNDSRRMLKIIAEIKRLCDLTPVELSEFLTNVKSICEYNQKVLLNQNTFLTQLN